jgi:hypothetical protein
VGIVSEGHGMIVGSVFGVMVRYISLVYQFLFRLSSKHIEYWLELCCITCTIFVCMIKIMIMTMVVVVVVVMMMMIIITGGGGEEDDDYGWRRRRRR